MSDGKDFSRDVGEIKGMLTIIQTMMSSQHADANRRMDDLHRSVSTRLDEHKIEIAAAAKVANDALTEAKTASAAVESLRSAVTRKSAASGAGASAIVAAALEGIKLMLGSG